MPENNFKDRCYSLLKKVPAGQLTTYKELAEQLGSKGYRAVGNAMATNPYAPRVPCHRVVRSDGRIGGFAFGPKEKIRLLREEGIEIRDGRVVNLKRYTFTAWKR